MASAAIDLKINIPVNLKQEITIEIGHSKLIVPRDRLVRALVNDVLNIEPASVAAHRAPDLNEGEHYAGILLGKNGEPDHHLILLPHEIADADWSRAMNMAKELGGELPTRREQALLYANLPEQFKKEYYWSCEQHAEYADYAWGQLFGNCVQSYWHKTSQCRARAVRRSIIR